MWDLGFIKPTEKFEEFIKNYCCYISNVLLNSFNKLDIYLKLNLKLKQKMFLFQFLINISKFLTYIFSKNFNLI